MTKFIEVHKNGERRLINLSHVELIECNTDGICVIYFAFSVPYPNAIVQDSIMPDETYEQIKNKILGGE